MQQSCQAHGRGRVGVGWRVQQSCQARGREFHIVNPHNPTNDDSMVVGLLRSIAEQSLRRMGD